MVKIVIENLGQKEVIADTSAGTILQVLQTQFIDWMHACGAKGRCTTCKMIVVAGMDQLSACSPVEINYKEQGMLKDQERLACQTYASGDCIIRVPEKNRLPHVVYTK